MNGRGDYDASLHAAIDELQALRRKDRAEKRERILALAREGLSIGAISSRLGLNRRTVWEEVVRAGLTASRKDLPIGLPVPGL